jgi:hypothetical protein
MSKQTIVSSVAPQDDFFYSDDERWIMEDKIHYELFLLEVPKKIRST